MIWIVNLEQIKAPSGETRIPQTTSRGYRARSPVHRHSRRIGSFGGIVACNLGKIVALGDRVYRHSYFRERRLSGATGDTLPHGIFQLDVERNS